MTRFVDPTHPDGQPQPAWGDSACFVGDTLRVYKKSSDVGEYRSYHEYVKVSSTADEWALSGYFNSYRSSPCATYAVYNPAEIPSTVEGSAHVATSAFLVVALIICTVWAIVRPIFPRSVFAGLRR